MSTEHNFDRGLGAGNDKLQLVVARVLHRFHVSAVAKFYRAQYWFPCYQNTPQQVVDFLDAIRGLRNHMLTWATFHRQEIEQSLQTVRGVSKHLIVVIHSEFSSPGMISSKSPPFFTFPHSRFPCHLPNHLSRIGQIHHHTRSLKPSPEAELTEPPNLKILLLI